MPSFLAETRNLPWSVLRSLSGSAPFGGFQDFAQASFVDSDVGVWCHDAGGSVPPVWNTPFGLKDRLLDDDQGRSRGFFFQLNEKLACEFVRSVISRIFSGHGNWVEALRLRYDERTLAHVFKLAVVVPGGVVYRSLARQTILIVHSNSDRSPERRMPSSRHLVQAFCFVPTG